MSFMASRINGKSTFTIACLTSKTCFTFVRRIPLLHKGPIARKAFPLLASPFLSPVLPHVAHHFHIDTSNCRLGRRMPFQIWDKILQAFSAPYICRWRGGRCCDVISALTRSTTGWNECKSGKPHGQTTRALLFTLRWDDIPTYLGGQMWCQNHILAYWGNR